MNPPTSDRDHDAVTREFHIQVDILCTYAILLGFASIPFSGMIVFYIVWALLGALHVFSAKRHQQYLAHNPRSFLWIEEEKMQALHVRSRNVVRVQDGLCSVATLLTIIYTIACSIYIATYIQYAGGAVLLIATLFILSRHLYIILVFDIIAMRYVLYTHMPIPVLSFLMVFYAKNALCIEYTDALSPSVADALKKARDQIVDDTPNHPYFIAQPFEKTLSLLQTP